MPDWLVDLAVRLAAMTEEESTAKVEMMRLSQSTPEGISWNVSQRWASAQSALVLLCRELRDKLKDRMPEQTLPEIVWTAYYQCRTCEFAVRAHVAEEVICPHCLRETGQRIQMQEDIGHRIPKYERS